MRRDPLEEARRMRDDQRDHTALCVAAIEAIGGDPALVGEMVQALEQIATHECMCCLGECTCGGRYEDIARAVLSRVKGA